jgi:hypothetical protein
MLESEQTGARTSRVCTDAPVRALLTFEQHIMATAARTIGRVTVPDAVWREVGEAMDADQTQ